MRHSVLKHAALAAALTLSPAAALAQNDTTGRHHRHGLCGAGAAGR